MELYYLGTLLILLTFAGLGGLIGFLIFGRSKVIDLHDECTVYIQHSFVNNGWEYIYTGESYLKVRYPNGSLCEVITAAEYNQAAGISVS
jgi:hypothetical protein